MRHKPCWRNTTDSDTLLRARYRQRFKANSGYRSAVWRILFEDFFAVMMPKHGVVLDVGCGRGEFINHVRAARRLALDQNPENAQLMDEGVEFLAVDCARPWPVPSEYVDVVFTSNFIEHLPSRDALSCVFLEAARVSRPGGTFICLGPNIRYTGMAYWDFPDHVIPLTERAVVEVMVASGFKIDRCVARFLPYTMSIGRLPPLGLLRLYLRLPLLWRVFGKQFLVVGKRTAAQS